MAAKDYKIATLGSHTALQILKGARDEGFETIAVCTPQMAPVYKNFRAADKFIEISSVKDFFSVEEQLIRENAILIPHASLITYLNLDAIERMRVMYYGNKKILRWESDRLLERKLLQNAGLKLPRIFDSPAGIDRPVIVKFYGAKGGKGYFVVKNEKEFEEKMKQETTGEQYIIQEYIVGVPLYAHYFYSRMSSELEIMGFDKRYESNVDSIGRIAAKDQMNLNLETSYNIVGNIPVVVRESLLPQIFSMGTETVKAAEDAGGLFGPFCLEMIITPQLDFYVFELSARIVAGTNPYIAHSPYTYVRYNEPMSTGRRIAREIREAIAADRLDEILG
ncbi:MAG: formate--phosphoribosylaminoimidazolecarboxamide ligase [Candidatus Aenigmarchaeota archaeon]|nr:formate--phosphoribosylaminoimidazolecarboxamide ligase [Candidatus Aenigmarchaeota archaeon]